MAKKKENASYYQRYKKELKQIVNDYEFNRNALFSTSDFSVFNTVEDGITKHPLRYYQLEALYMLDYLYSNALAQIELSKKTNKRIEPLISDLLDKINKD